MSRKIWTFCVFIFVVMHVHAQLPEATQQFLPKLLPKSPEAAALAKYGTYEVSMYSGVPNISIPLYEIQVGELSVPISLSYHASGNKVTDMSSWVGLGWSVSAGGSISRKVMGRPDELQGGYLNGLNGQNPVRLASSINNNDQTDLNYLKNIVQGYYDVEPDIYSYSMPGKSGKFLYNYNESNLATPIILPYDPVEITRSQPTVSTQLFKLIDESGIQYRFDTYEWTETDANTIVNNYAISTWLLSHMISANKQDTIYFNYNQRSGAGSTDESDNETLVISDNAYNMVNPPIYLGEPVNLSSGKTTSTTTWQIQKEIIFRTGKLVFEQGTDNRLDATGGKDAPKRLNAIKVYSYNSALNGYKLIKTIKFYQSYFINSSDQSKRLRLDSIGIFEPTETIGLKTRFEYNTSASLPKYDEKSKDYWGYYNGKNNNTLIPRMSIPYNGGSLDIGGTEYGRDPNPAFMQAYVLNKIIHPTGGNTQFEFETNQYKENGGAVKFSGGLRVKKIKSYDGVSSNPVVKTYKYGVGESGFGRANFTLNNYFFQSTQNYRYWKLIQGGFGEFIAATKRVRSFFSAPTNDLEPYDGVPVGYATVTEYIGDETTNMGKTVFQFNDQADVFDQVAAYGRPVVNSYHFNRGQLIQKDVFRKNSSDYTKIASTINQYEAFSQQWLSNIGLVVFKLFINQGESYGNNFCGPASVNNKGCNDSSSYQFGNYSVRAGDNKLVKTTEILYDEDDPSRSQTVVTDYTYGNINHQQITRIQLRNSKGELLQTTRKYPHEILASPYTEMVSNHIYNRTVEEVQENITLGVPLSKKVNNYNNWSNGNYLIGSIQYQNGSNSLETRAEFLQYDNLGNIQEMKKTQDISIAYLWDYKQSMVVAEVKNASQNKIAYTSFESDGKGNWQFAGVPFWDGSAPTGKKVYALSSGSITRTGLGSSGVYIVSYWSKSGNQNVSNTVSYVTGRSLNGWTQYEHSINNPVSGNIIISGSGTIDELRLYPFEAQMFTRTYEPLVGITSECDMANHITYYEYDDLKRLMLVRDQDQKIVKKLCYNYNGEQENCNIFYNVAKQNTFTKSCPPNNTGGAVTYIVPANVYSAYSQVAADAMAQTDVNTNGQAYANATGTCSISQLNIIEGYNATSVNYLLKLSNQDTTIYYTLIANENNNSSSPLFSVPTGTYKVEFFRQGLPISALFKFNNYSFSSNCTASNNYSTCNATFDSVLVNTSSQVSIQKILPY